MNRRIDETIVPVLPVGVTIADISQILTGFGRNLGAPGGNGTQWVAPNLAGISSLFNINCNCDTGVAGSDDRQNTSVYHHTGRQFNFGLKYTF